MLKEFRARLLHDTQALDAAGLLKRERVIDSAQGPWWRSPTAKK